MIKKLIIPIFVLLSLQSCSILEKRICSNYESDNQNFRATANAVSTDTQFAQDKALMIAKQEIAEDVDIYILDKFSHETFLEDPEFETKLNAARKSMLSDISIVCSKVIPKHEMFKAFVAIEISKETIDAEIEKKLKEVTQ